MTAISIIQCTMMAVIVLFFTVCVNNFSVYSIIYGIFLMFIFSKITFGEQKKKGSSGAYRKIAQFLYAILFSISFIHQLIAERGSMAISKAAMANAELPFCHIAIPQVLVPLAITKSIVFPARISGHYAAVASMLCIWFIFTLTIGRGWCSWVCFYGGWETGFSSIAKKKRINLLSKNRELREFQFGFFAFIVLASLGSLAAIYCDWFCPFKLVTEYIPMNSALGIISGIIFIGLFIGLVVVMPFLTKRRTQCSTLCPFGAFASLTDGISMFRIKINTDKCKGCMKCASACSFGAIDISTIRENRGRPEITCAKCGDCIGACPQKAIAYDFRFTKKCPRPQADTRAAKFIQNFLDPALLFRFSAFTFYAIMSSTFSVQSMELIVQWIKNLF